MYRAVWNGAGLAESDDTVKLEGRRYFPVEALRQEYLADSPTTSTCPWKGRAHYYDVQVNGRTNPNAAWYYASPSGKHDRGLRRLLARRARAVRSLPRQCRCQRSEHWRRRPPGRTATTTLRTPAMTEVTVYWRPGCPYCLRLRQDLRAIGVPAQEINIWADGSAASTVRQMTSGNETVPTVVIGGRGLINPSAPTVLAELRRQEPGFRPDQKLARAGHRLRRLRTLQWLLVGGIMVVSLLLDALGHSGLSWGLDGVALALYLAFRLIAVAAADR